MEREDEELRINTEVNACLRLLPLPNFAEGECDARRVRALMVGERCEALDFLDDLQRSSPFEARKLLQLLAKIAASPRMPALATIKRVGNRNLVYQIDGHKNARLYCFEAGSTLVICVSGFWIGKGNKRAHQNEAIKEAEGLMELWLSAIPLEQGDEDD